jgi:DnaJ-class molecular chaperone
MRSAGENAEKQRCPVCLGTKVSWYNAAMGRKRPCRKCEGTGVIGASHTIEVSGGGARADAREGLE